MERKFLHLTQQSARSIIKKYPDLKAAPSIDLRTALMRYGSSWAVRDEMGCGVLRSRINRTRNLIYSIMNTVCSKRRVNFK